jgi:RimJ/RimL family protein N-acetyltransferase
LRFAVWPEARGRGLAREAAGAALRYAHDVAGIERIIAVAREENFGSRMVLGGIGMVEVGSYVLDGRVMLLFDSLQPRQPR